MKRICIDYGHGGSSGARSGNLIEDNLINITGKECVAILKASGFEVKTTRNETTNMSLSDRAKISNNFKADLFVSIHFNMGGGRGLEIIRSLRESTVSVGVSNKILSKLDGIGQVARPTPIYTRKGSSGKDYYGVLRQTTCPAIIIEGGFMDNSKDAKFLSSEANLKALGRIYAEAIIEYYHGKVVYPGKTTTTNKKEETTTSKKEETTTNKTEKIDQSATVGVVNLSMGNVLAARKGPNDKADKIEMLYNGTEVELLCICTGYWAIKFDNKKSTGIAFVDKDYIKIKK